MSKIIAFIKLHTKGIIIGLIATICVASVGIGGVIYLHNKNKVDETVVENTTAADSTLVSEKDNSEDVVSKDTSSEDIKETTISDKDTEKADKTEKATKDNKKSSKDSSNSEKVSTKSNEKVETKADTAANTSSSSKSEGNNSSSSNSSSSSSGNSTSKSSGTSSNSDSSSNKEQKTTEAPKTSNNSECQHNWVWATKTVHHDAVTHVEDHWEPAWDEPIYRQGTRCSACGTVYNSYEDFRAQDSCGGAYSHTDVLDHYEHHDAELLWSETITDKEAWDEEVNDYQYCSKCGARK